MTSNETCEPNTEVSAVETTVVINENTTEERVCFKTKDVAGNISETKCSEAYKVDGTAPTGNSIVINNKDASTTSTSVTLTLASTGASEMCISNTTSCSNWESYTTSKAHTLTTGLGTKTVYVYFRDEAGNTTITVKVSAGTNHTAPSNKTISVTVKNPYSARDTILANMISITTRSSFSSVFTTSTTATIFTAEDNDGTSYYFAGAPTDNWVKFGGYYWRIVRINGDGTIRLIYNRTTTTTTGTGTLALTKIYNTSRDNNMYVGYMYTSGQVHGDGTSSNIKHN